MGKKISSFKFIDKKKIFNELQKLKSRKAWAGKLLIASYMIF